MRILQTILSIFVAFNLEFETRLKNANTGIGGKGLTLSAWSSEIDVYSRQILTGQENCVKPMKIHIQNLDFSNNDQPSYNASNFLEMILSYINNDIFSAQDCGEITALPLLNLQP